MSSTRNASPDPERKKAEDALVRLCSGDLNSALRSVEEICIATNRDLSKMPRNRDWVAENGRVFQYFDLAHVTHEGRTVTGLQIHTEGMRILRAAAAPAPHGQQNSGSNTEPTLDSVIRDIKRLCQLDPHLHVDFSFNFREGVRTA